MRTFDIGFHRKARVWSDDLPDLRYEVAQVVERTYEARTSASTDMSCVAVELFIPLGGRFYCGVLGATFTPDQSNILVVQVAISANDSKQVGWLLASGIDRMLVGLPSAYAASVIEGSVAAQVLGAGTLRFDRAAYGAIGSSERLFWHLADTVARVLAMHKGGRTAELQEIFSPLSGYW